MKDSIGKSIGQNIRELREKYGISRIDMALELGYSPANYGKIENGKQSLTCQGLITLCNYFDCGPERIIYGEDGGGQEYFPDYLSGYSESEKRRFLRILYLLFNCQRIQAGNSFHNFFGSDLLGQIPDGEDNVLPYVLEFERKTRDLPRRKMIAFLGISKNKYYDLLGGQPLSDIDTLVRLHRKLGYDMGFLLFNKVDPRWFLSVLDRSWNAPWQKLIERQMKLCADVDQMSGGADDAGETDGEKK